MQLRVTRTVLPVLLAAVGAAGAQQASAQRERRTIPADTVVRVRLDDRISSRTATVGDRFSTTVADEDRSGFPAGTRLHGVVSEVQQAGAGRPGVVDMEFRRAVLPDGTNVQIDGRLASLAQEDVRRTRDGRMVTRRTGSEQEKFQPKWIGYGAGAGAVLATIFGGNFLKGALLGGLGGAVYGYVNRDKADDRDVYREVDLAAGTEFGVRLNDTVAFGDRPAYRYTTRDDRLDNERDDRVARDDRPAARERVLGERSEYRYGSSTVMLNGRRVEFTDARPVNINGVLYLPLAAIADAADLRYDHRPGDDYFSIRTPDGLAEGYTGETRVSVRNQPDATLEAAPLSIDGEVYVPTEYLTRVAGMQVNWDRRNMRLELESGR